MSKRNNNTDPIEDLFSLFEAIGSLVIGLITVIKWIIDTIIYFIVKTIEIISKIQIKKNMKKSFTKNKEEPLTKENIYKKLNLFNMDIYNDIFLPQIRYRGEEYYEQGKVKYFRQNNNNKYTCRIKGTDSYNVSISFEIKDERIIANKTCTCPYYKEQKNCKHIYALLYKIKCEKNKEILLKEIEKTIKETSEIIEKTTNYLQINNLIIPTYTKTIYPHIETIKNILNLSFSCSHEDTLIKYLQRAINERKEIENYASKIINKKDINNSNKYLDYNNQEQNFKTFDFYLNEKEEDSEYTKEQLEHLEPWQLELVKKGEYAPSGFEEEEPEDDDWHSDDEEK